MRAETAFGLCPHCCICRLVSEGFEPGGDADVGEVGVVHFVEDEADHAPTISQTVRSGSLTE